VVRDIGGCEGKKATANNPRHLGPSVQNANVNGVQFVAIARALLSFKGNYLIDGTS
jgi:hypothetical protein